MKTLQVTAQDLRRLRALSESVITASRLETRSAEALQEELAKAQIILPEAAPADLVTMRSRVQVRDLDSGYSAAWTLSYPEEANWDAGRISVLAPLGLGILGAHAGEVVEWKVPAGRRRLKLEALEYQPEAAGHWDL